MVRLEGIQRHIAGGLFQFQFQYGTIGSYPDGASEAAIRKFQFQYGTIGSRLIAIRITLKYNMLSASKIVFIPEKIVDYSKCIFSGSTTIIYIAFIINKSKSDIVVVLLNISLYISLTYTDRQSVFIENCPDFVFHCLLFPFQAIFPGGF